MADENEPDERRKLLKWLVGSGSAVFAWAGGGGEPTPAWPEVPHGRWTGRMCRSLAGHPLADW